jgi:streptomycin 6-kinase
MPVTIETIPASLRERWRICDGALLADTRSSLVFRVKRLDTAPAIVKILKPEGMNELPGMAYLAWRGGCGAVDLIDRQDSICLLEDAGTIILRDHHRDFGDEAATEIILTVLKKLNAPSVLPPPDDLVPLRTHFSALFEAVGRGLYPAYAELLRWGATLTEDLLAQQTAIRPLHGDLHHDNIVSGGARGWLAIDPQGLIGDPAYEVANVFGNPIGGIKDILDPARIVRLTEAFAAAIGRPEKTILQFAAAHAAVSICWSSQGEPDAEAEENIFERSAFATLARQMLDEKRFR